MSRATGVVVAAVLGCWAAACQAAESKKPEPLPAEVVAAWEKAGAKTGWMGPDNIGRIAFHAGGEGKEGEAPAFAFKEWREGTLSKLTPPEKAFGLSLDYTEVTDAGLKELAGLKQLQSLDIGRCKGVTDAGLKELAGLKQLQTLDLGLTPVRGAGLKELAGLKQLQTLDLGECKVTDAGLKELASLKQLQTLRLRGQW
jgi:internalin A